jgi:hypothetical protein
LKAQNRKDKEPGLGDSWKYDYNVFPYCSQASDYTGKGLDLTKVVEVERVLTDKDTPFGDRFFLFSDLKPATDTDLPEGKVQSMKPIGFLNMDGALEE